MPMLARVLASAHRLLSIARGHARARGLDEAGLLAQRLAPDMFCLSHQVRVLADGLDGALAQLAGHTADPHAGHVFNRGDEASLGPVDRSLDAPLARLAGSMARWQALPADARLAHPGDEIHVCRPGHGRRFEAEDFVWRYVLPNAWFHLAMIHALLRAAGVPVGKADFDGPRAWEPM